MSETDGRVSGGPPDEITGESDRVGVALDLSAPAAARAVAPAEAEAQIAVPTEAAKRISSIVEAFVEEMGSLDVHGDEYRRRVEDINGLGDREIRATSEMSNRLLDRPVRAVSGILEGKSPVGRKLIELRHTVEDLNPAKYELKASKPRRALGMIPLGDRLRNYFDKYTKAQSHIEGIVASLSDSRAELERDNAAIEQEERGLWAEIETLRQYAFMAHRLDEALEARIEEIERSDAGRGRTLREDVLFPVRRRRQEILTQLAVAAQGHAALRVVEQNNHEVVRAIKTATTTTVAALRTAVMVAQALTSQRLVVEQLQAVNDVTSGMIETTSSLLREQSTQVETRATSPGVDLAALQRAWDNVFAALDQIDSYKLNALAAMKVTVNELSREVERSQAYLERSQPTERATRTASGRSGESSTLRLE